MSNKGIFTFATLAALALTVAGPVSAQRSGGPGGPGRGRFPQPRAAYSRGILGQLIFPCPADCANDAKTCFDAADDAALSCVSGACAAEISAAQTACAEDRRSDECEEAVDALADCADTCLDTRAAALDTCHDTLRDCREACEGDE